MRPAVRAGRFSFRSRSVSRVHAAWLSVLFANGAARELEKDVLKVGENGAEIRDADPILRKTMNHLGDQVVAPPANGASRVFAGYGLYAGNGLKVAGGSGVVRIQDDGTLGTVPAHEALRSVDVDDSPVLHDGDPVAPPLSLF